MQSQEQLRTQVETFEGPQDPFLTEAIHNTARAMVEQSIRIQPGQNVLLWFDPPGLPLVKEMYHACMAKGANVSFFMRDLELDAQEISSLSPQDVKTRFDEERNLIEQANAVLLVRNSENPEALSVLPSDLMGAYQEGYKNAHHRRLIDLKDGGVNWCLFLYPTLYEAKKEGLPYDDYIRLYFEACNQPWEAIKQAQAKLKEKLDKGHQITFIANEEDPDPNRRTHLTMSIEGMTFCNSTIDKNYPGSEVFSAPVMDSVEGQVFAEGEYIYDSHLMKNIHLKFEKGKIIDAFAEEGNEGFQQILSQGEGARYLGEVAMGTNSGLTRRFFNDLFNEKVSGSFHIAIGHCYEYEEYGGEPVHVNNGNTEDRTPNHWDLTILMHNNGRVILDAEVIQENGVFKDPDLAILNPKFPHHS